MRTFGRLAVAGTAACLFLGLGAVGCDSGSVNRMTEPVQAPQPIDIVLPGIPAPISPDNLMRAFEWTYNVRSLDAYSEWFTEDFRWNCSPTDSADGPPWTRGDELAFAANLFQGGASDQPAAVSVTFQLARNLEVLPDPVFAAWDPLGRWHKRIRTPVQLAATLADQTSIEVVGYAIFSVVRGDSAMISEDLTSRGTFPDSIRWFIRRWGEESAPPVPAGTVRRAPLHAQPSSFYSWCGLKERYR